MPRPSWASAKKLVEVVLGKAKPAKARAPKVDPADVRTELTAKLKREASDDDLYSHLMFKSGRGNCDRYGAGQGLVR